MELAEQEALTLENKINESHPNILAEVRKNMDPILSEVAGVPVQSAVDQTGKMNFIWQFPSRPRTRSRQHKKRPRNSTKQYRRKTNTSTGRKSRSRRKSRKASQGTRQRKSRSRSTRKKSLTTRRQQTGGQHGGWRWFGWVRSPPPEAPATASRVPNQEPEERSTIRLIMERILTSSIFRQAVLVAAATWGLAKMVDSEFIATATAIVRNQVQQQLANRDYSETYGHILSGVLKLQAQYLLAAVTITTAAAVVTRQLLRRRTTGLIPEEPPGPRVRMSAEEHRRVAEAARAAQKKASQTANRPTDPLTEYLDAAGKNDHIAIRRLFDMYGVESFSRILAKPFTLSAPPRDLNVIRTILKAARSIDLDIPMTLLLPVYADNSEVIKILVHEFSAIAEIQPHLNCSMYADILLKHGHQVTCRWR